MDISQLDVRTKPSVKEGLVLNQSASADITVVDYQPGNGTRYFLSIVDTSALSDEVNSMLGFGSGKGGWIVTDLNVHRSMQLNSDGFISSEYVAEKMGCFESDACVLAELFGELLGREHDKAGP